MFLWAWGANSHGQLGIGVVSEQEVTPRTVTVSTIKDFSISCGGTHTILLDKGGNLYSAGSNDKYQLGSKEISCNSSVFERIWNLSGIKFIAVSCGWDFSCAITEDRFLFVWGSNSHGQLGLPRNHFPDRVTPIRLDVKAYDISTGLRHTAILNCKGEVWITGNGKFGQLGLGPDVKQLDRFQKVPKLGVISYIACGQHHTVAWCSQEGALYVWGDNKHRQLLLDTEKYPRIFYPQKIDIDIKQSVEKLLSGWTNNALLLKTGRLITWGRNTYGQLGCSTSSLSGLHHVSLPGGLEFDDVALGSEHTVCRASDGSLWAWGWNEHANTGTQKSCDIVPTPAPVSFPTDVYQVTGIYSGFGGHSFITATLKENK